MKTKGVCWKCGNPTKFYKLIQDYAEFCSPQCARTWKREHGKPTIAEEIGRCLS